MNFLITRQNIVTLRTTTQLLFTLFTLYSGWQFYLFYLWTIGERHSFILRPPAVEAFLPIGALVSLKRLLLTAVYDPIHPAALTIFLAALTTSLLLRKGFCGWICPVGFTSNLVEKIARRAKTLIHLPPWIDYPLRSLKYLLLAFFLYIIVIKMNIEALEQFSNTPYNIAADAKMLLFFIHPSNTTLVVLGLLFTISFFLRNFWCRSLCPYGALLGILALASPLQVKRQQAHCIDCKRCEKVCPGAIKITAKKTIFSPECIGCGECIAICPQEECLQLSFRGKTPVHFLLLPTAVLLLFFLFYSGALLSDHWHSEVPLHILKQYFQLAAGLVHP